MDAIGVLQRAKVTAGLFQRRANDASSRPDQWREGGYRRAGRIDRVGFGRASPHLRAPVTGLR
jgi:hypothetical protein